MSVVVHNLYCVRGSDQQETSGRNLNGQDKILKIIMIITIHNHHYKNICASKLLAHAKI
jgi:hypothetical protein